jgi:hypothetical protein
MIELEKEFIGTGEVAGSMFTQLCASPYAYVYEITALNSKPHYEVFKRKECQESETVVRGIKVQFTAKVLYPRSNDFGEWAWSPRTLSEAMKYFDQLNKEGQLKIKKIRHEEVYSGAQL